jgi:hypothetical protein
MKILNEEGWKLFYKYAKQIVIPYYKELHELQVIWNLL